MNLKEINLKASKVKELNGFIERLNSLKNSTSAICFRSNPKANVPIEKKSL